MHDKAEAFVLHSNPRQGPKEFANHALETHEKLRRRTLGSILPFPAVKSEIAHPGEARSPTEIRQPPPTDEADG
jgi:hypothetical protein